jgi:hypothetical protein
MTWNEATIEEASARDFLGAVLGTTSARCMHPGPINRIPLGGRRWVLVQGSAAPPALRILAIRLPALPGWADVWLPALRAWVRFAVHRRLSHTLVRLGFKKPAAKAGESSSRADTKGRTFKRMYFSAPEGSSVPVPPTFVTQAREAWIRPRLIG